MNTLIPFKSRAEAIKLSRALKTRHVANTVINTPRGLGVSCGLSVLFSAQSTDLVKETISTLKLQTAQGVFRR